MKSRRPFPDWLRQIAQLGPIEAAPAEPLPQNAHIHLPPNFSAFDTVDEVIDMAKSEKIAALLAVSLTPLLALMCRFCSK